MKKQKLSPGFLKDVEIISKDQLKTLMGGNDQPGDGTIGDGDGDGPCRELGVACNQSVQCCSNNCAADSSSSSTGKSCKS